MKRKKERKKTTLRVERPDKIRDPSRVSFVIHPGSPFEREKEREREREREEALEPN